MLWCRRHLSLSPWNQKNLDYEIETLFMLQLCRRERNSWNQKNLDYEIETKTCETDAADRRTPWNQKNLDYEIETVIKSKSVKPSPFLKSKEPRLRDWNLRCVVGQCSPGYSWNQKNLDYEIETRSSGIRKPASSTTWNQKNLDYEIETLQKLVGYHLVCQPLKSKEPRLRDWNLTQEPIWPKSSGKPWNQKNLDYEIETRLGECCFHFRIKLEIKRTSITRLKHHEFGIVGLDALILKSKEPRLRDWNGSSNHLSWYGYVTWNQKNLDYEIETLKDTEIRSTSSCLKSKEPRLRDWNMSNLFWCKRTSQPWNQKNLDYEIETRTLHCKSATRSLLKSKEPRLRDWNESFGTVRRVRIPLEIKRTSITRLKLEFKFHLFGNYRLHLKSKEPRLRDWNSKWG